MFDTRSLTDAKAPTDPGGTTQGPSLRHADAAALLTLQRQAGNRAVGALMRQLKADVKPARSRTVSLVVVPGRVLTGEEFAALVSAQLHGISEGEAAARRDEFQSTDPHFVNGVRSSEVGKPIRVEVVPPQLGEGEAQDVRSRAEQFSGLGEAERRAIDEEANRRFQRKRGLATGAKPTHATDQALWDRTRDEVVRDRNRLDALPDAIRSVLMPGGRRPAPEQYAAGLRLADRFRGFSGQDWALYQRRGGALKGDYGTIEASMDRFASERAGERKVIERVRGTEPLYALVREFRVAQSMGMTAKQERRWPKYESMLKQLAASGFKTVAEYEVACAAYLRLFRKRARELTMLALDGSTQTAQAELRRSYEPQAMKVMLDSLAPVRKLLAEFGQQVQMYDAYDKLDEANAARARLAKSHPVLADPKLTTMELAASSPAALGVVVRRVANERLDDIRTTRDRVNRNEDVVLKLDRVVELTHGELGATPGSVGQQIVQARMDEIKNDETFKSLSLFVIAVGVGMLSLGTGSVVVLSNAGALGVSLYQAHDEWEKYENAAAAARTDFDRAQSVSSQDPSVLWLALALVGVVVDVTQLAAALKAARPALNVLETTGDLARFEAKLAEARTLSPELQAVVSKAAAAERDFAAALRRARMAMSLNVGAGPGVLLEVTKMAFHAARIGVRKFEVFLAMVKARKELLRGFDVGSLSADQLKAWEEAFKAGVREFDATRPVIHVPSAKGPGGKVTFRDDGEMLLDGKPVGMTKRDDVMKRLDLKHTDRGHGPHRDELTIANEAFLNARNNPRGNGMSSIWASDEVMVQSLNTAKEQLRLGRARPVPGGSQMVEFGALGHEGRVFVANTHLPPGARVVNPAPFPNLAVAELAVNRIRAFFKNGKLETIFPAFVR